MFEFEKVLLQLDEDEIINSETFYHANLFIWPFIRHEIYELLMAGEVGFQERHGKPTESRKTPVGDIDFKSYYEAHKNNLEIIHKHKILFLCNMVRSVLTKNGKIFDKEIDYFVNLHESSYISYIAYNNQYHENRYIDNSSYMNHIFFKGTLYNRLKSIAFKKEYPILTYLYRNNIIDNKWQRHLNEKLCQLDYTLPIIKKNYIKFLNHIEPEIVFIRLASYGRYAHLVRWAKEIGVKVGEFQHGLISQAHMAYNYSNKLYDNDQYKAYWPDYILTYGDYWNKQIGIPCKKYVVGNPHFCTSKQNYFDIYEDKNTVLILSQGTMTKKFVELAIYLSQNLKDYKVVFKLHPTEVYFEDRYEVLYKYNNIEVVKTGDIYEYIAKYEKIIAHTSTVAFEATAFNKRIFILDDEHTKRNMPDTLGMRFEEPLDLVHMLREQDSKEVTYDSEYYFNCNWAENYRNFLNDELSL